jgi:Cys-tRNA(Pro) deacylase
VDEWPEPVQRVSAFLREAGAEARIEQLSTHTETAQAAADAIGCDLRAIVKSLVFDCDGRPVLVLVPGDRRADGAKVAALAGAARARPVPPERVEEITGFVPGAVAPFPQRRVERTLIDQSLLLEARVWVGAGSTNHMAGLPSSELVRLTRGRTVDVAAEPS